MGVAMYAYNVVGVAMYAYNVVSVAAARGRRQRAHRQSVQPAAAACTTLVSTALGFSGAVFEWFSGTDRLDWDGRLKKIII